MSLLHEIQKRLLDDEKSVGPALLQFRLLAAKLGVPQMEEWVKLETEGYEKDVDVPEYRKMSVTYRGSFSGGSMGPQLNNVQIPSHIIQREAGEAWVSHEVRESLTSIDALIRSTRDSGQLAIDASNLILLLQDKIYKGLAIHDITGTIGTAAISAIQNTVRNRLLELTIELEKQFPEAAKIEIGAPIEFSQEDAAKVGSGVFNTVFNGPITMNTAQQLHINTKIVEGNINSVQEFLIERGIEPEAASVISGEITNDPPKDASDLNAKSNSWLSKLGDTGMGVSAAIAKELAITAAKEYFGFPP